MMHDLVAALHERGVRARTLTVGANAARERQAMRRVVRGVTEAGKLARRVLRDPANLVVLMTDPPLLPLLTGPLQRRGC